MKNNNSFDVIRQFIETPIKDTMELYVQYVREGLISKDNAKNGIETAGALACVFEKSMPKKQAKTIGEYRRNVINWAKSVIDDLETEGNENGKE